MLTNGKLSEELDEINSYSRLVHSAMDSSNKPSIPGVVTNINVPSGIDSKLLEEQLERIE